MTSNDKQDDEWIGYENEEGTQPYQPTGTLGDDAQQKLLDAYDPNNDPLKESPVLDNSTISSGDVIAGGDTIISSDTIAGGDTIQNNLGGQDDYGSCSSDGGDNGGY